MEPVEHVVATELVKSQPPKNPFKKTRQKRKPESGATKRKRKRAKLLEKQEEFVREDNTEDDRTIQNIEKLMKIKKKKTLPSAFASDGLDFLLDVIGQGETESGLNDLKNETKNYEDGDVIHHSDGLDSDDEEGDDQDEDILDDVLSDVPEEDFDDASDEPDEEDLVEEDEMGSDAGWVNEVESEDVSEEEASVIDDEENNAVVVKPVETEESISGKYVPPALRRNMSEKENEKRRKLERQIKGWLNRLSESNLGMICSEICAIYQVNSRAFVTEILTDVILVQFFTPDPIPERLITESSMLIGVLCHNIGVEVVAHFIEAACRKLGKIFLMQNYGKGKECNNIVQLLCSLYQVRTMQTQIVLDLIEKFIVGFTEKDIELLVLVLKNVGFQLRKDNPILLKEIVEKITKQSQELTQDNSSRMKYMLEVLTAIKNNNVRKVTEYDVELLNNRRKKIKLLIKAESEILPDVSFQDLVDAETKGRWWIVGSSWKGVPMLKKSTETTVEVDTNVSSQLIEAARKLRMNTDVRRGIFYAIMSAEDYMDAFERVVKMGLKGKQLREISHVVVECCIQQRSFNLFYYHLLNKFCLYNREFIMTTQCTFWDKFKLLASYSKMQLSNLSSLVSSLLLSQALPLACLKTLEYTEMDKPMVSFLRQVLIRISRSENADSKISEIFPKLGSSKHSLVRQGLKLFIQHFMLGDANFIDSADDGEIKKEERILAVKCGAKKVVFQD
uniref:Nucleolar MIF4G domain-containing protein 1 n=1 Tax=Ciona intestinalis TaxID=7719 RepID=F6XVD3_CIOIN